MFKILISVLSVVTIVNVAAAQNCTARVNVTQTARDQDAYGATFKYRIEVTSDASSAVVHFKIRRAYDVNGAPYSQSEPWYVVVQGGQAQDAGELRVSSSLRQIQWSVEDILCKKTDAVANTGNASPLAANAPDGIDPNANRSDDGFAFSCHRGSRQIEPLTPWVAEGSEFTVTATSGKTTTIGVFWGMTFRLEYYKEPDVTWLIVGQEGDLQIAASSQRAAVQLSVTQNHIRHDLFCVRHM